MLETETIEDTLSYMIDNLHEIESILTEIQHNNENVTSVSSFREASYQLAESLDSLAIAVRPRKN